MAAWHRGGGEPGRVAVRPPPDAVGIQFRQTTTALEQDGPAGSPVAFIGFAQPPRNGMPPSIWPFAPRIMFIKFPFLSFFIIFCICSNCFSILLMS